VSTQRENGSLPAEQILDVRYADLMSDPFGTVRRIYEHFDLRLSDEAEDHMRAYLKVKPQGKHGAHVYSFADTGLDLEQERARFAAYQERYGVASEI
jgi:hypothetical protein